MAAAAVSGTAVLLRRLGNCAAAVGWAMPAITPMPIPIPPATAERLFGSVCELFRLSFVVPSPSVRCDTAKEGLKALV